MKYPGYYVDQRGVGVSIKLATFDETELDPATDWQEIWQNQDANDPVKGFVGLDAALLCAAAHLAKAEDRVLAEVDLDRIRRFEPEWQNDCVVIHSLSQLLETVT